jgi:serine/threonine protein phosphatase 1
VSIPLWENQGGRATMLSYDYDRRNVPQSHIDLLKSAVPYYIDDRNNLYVHGGFDERYPIEEQDPETLMWDRDLVYKYGRGYAKGPIKEYKRVFLGHTSTQGIMHDWNATDPIITDNVIALDTGGGWNGKLTIMNVDTLEYWQSDIQTPSQ